MKTSIFSLSTLTLIAAVAALAPSEAAASTCTIAVQETKLNNGVELDDGVPNYAQGNFEPGSGDCSPTAIAMVMGYWDANGWSCLMPGTGPYTGGATPAPAIKGAVDYFKINLDYADGVGTYHTLFNPWAAAIKNFVTRQDSGASGWTVHDDFWLSDWDVTSEIDAGRPVVFSVLGVSGKQLHWNSPTGAGSGHEGIISHSMAAHGYRRVVEGAWLFGSCVDWLDADEFYVSLRSGWVNGGNSELYYNWGVFDGRSAVKVQPSGSASCSDSPVQPCAWTNDGECDEPEGLGYCAEGTDVADCTCQYQFDGECDEPWGTNVCPAYSDAADC